MLSSHLKQYKNLQNLWMVSPRTLFSVPPTFKPTCLTPSPAHYIKYVILRHSQWKGQWKTEPLKEILTGGQHSYSSHQRRWLRLAGLYSITLFHSGTTQSHEITLRQENHWDSLLQSSLFSQNNPLLSWADLFLSECSWIFCVHGGCTWWWQLGESKGKKLSFPAE